MREGCLVPLGSGVTVLGPGVGWMGPWRPGGAGLLG